MPWVETESPSFHARHESADSEAAGRLLHELERFRTRLEQLFEIVPGDVTVVIHPRSAMLTLANPWLPLARALSAPAGRRYFAGTFAPREIHVLAPAELERRASGSAGSREALLLSPLHEYAHLVVGANNPALPPPFTPAAFAGYVRKTWLCEGSAVHLSGQAPHMRAAVVRRLREGGRPSFPPGSRDALVLGGTVFSLLEREQGPQACVGLALTGRLEEVFGRSFADIGREWLAYVEAFSAA
ncbi:MAG: hypothetical protein ACR2HC_08010 [Thermoleophilaceae bacterium]